jgi:hypothetical protein
MLVLDTSNAIDIIPSECQAQEKSVCRNQAFLLLLSGESLTSGISGSARLSRWQMIQDSSRSECQNNARKLGRPVTGRTAITEEALLQRGSAASAHLLPHAIKPPA